MARMYGLEHAEQLLGTKVKDLLDPSDTANINYLRSFIRSRYRVVNAESHEIDKNVNLKYFLNNTIGVVEGDFLVRVWGTQRDITTEKQAGLIEDVVFRIAQAQDTYQTLQDFYKEVHKLIQEVMPAKNFYIALFDKERDLLSFPYFVDEIDKPDPPRKLGRGVTEYVIRTGKSLLCTPEVDKELMNQGEIELVGIMSKIWLGVPLVVNEQVIGMIAVQDYSDVNRFGPEQQRTLEFASIQIAKAIDRKRTLETVRRSEERFQEFVEGTPIGHFIADVDGTVIDCNPALCNLFGFTNRSDAINAHINIFGNTKRSRDDLQKRFQKKLFVYEYELKIVDVSGRAVPVIANYVATRNESGELKCIRGTIVPKTTNK
jgi:PAS domain S-box-containing protein